MRPRFAGFTPPNLFLGLLVCGATLACSGGGGSPYLPEPDYLVGDWGVTSVEGAVGPVDSSNSVWTFDEDGTYDWFFYFEGYYDVSGGGTYDFDEVQTRMDINGAISTYLLSETDDPNDLDIDASGPDTFSFLDEDGDRWVYQRLSD